MIDKLVQISSRWAGTVETVSWYENIGDGLIKSATLLLIFLIIGSFAVYFYKKENSKK